MKRQALVLLMSAFAAIRVSAQNPLTDPKGLIRDKKTVTAVAEAILFSIYGKGNIIAQRPYGVKLDDGRWYIDGTVPDKRKPSDVMVFGGSFHIVLSQKDGRVWDIGYEE